MIRYSNMDGFIKSQGIKDEKDSRETIPKLSHVAIGIFSYKLLIEITKIFPSKLVGYTPGANIPRPIFNINYKGVDITLFNAGVGGPIIAGDIEDLSFNGVDTFIIFGNCGVLDKNIEDCSIVIPTIAYREDGTSYHYIEESDYIEISNKYKDNFVRILNEYNFAYTEGPTWTTDAFYRETKEKIDYFKAKGVKTVEMEASTIAAVCKRKNLNYFIFFYAGDNLDSTTWDRRSISQETNFDLKKKVPILAMELAKEIN